jgi:hypothetical protein
LQLVQSDGMQRPQVPWGTLLQSIHTGAINPPHIYISHSKALISSRISKTRGLFVGVSIEGTIILERKETNAAFYHRKVSAKEILSGTVPPPPAAEALYRALERRTNLEKGITFEKNNDETHHQPSIIRKAPISHQKSPSVLLASSSTKRPPPPRALSRSTCGNVDKVVALYDFVGERDGDLDFVCGDEIVVLERRPNDWWLGRLNGMEGVFPANYGILQKQNPFIYALIIFISVERR